MAKLIYVSCMLAMFLVASTVVEQAAAAKKDKPAIWDCRYDEANCEYCCDQFGEHWTSRWVTRSWYSNTCHCTSPDGDRSETLTQMRFGGPTIELYYD